MKKIIFLCFALFLSSNAYSETVSISVKSSNSNIKLSIETALKELLDKLDSYEVTSSSSASIDIKLVALVIKGKGESDGDIKGVSLAYVITKNNVLQDFNHMLIQYKNIENKIKKEIKKAIKRIE